MTKQLVASIDGVMVKAGGQFRTLYKDGAVPEGADADHVKVLVDRGLLVDASAQSEPDDDPDGDGPLPAKSASKADWKSYALTQGMSEADAEAKSRDDLVALYVPAT